MDLILWRHAEAHDLEPDGKLPPGHFEDLQRPLTGRGQKHAARVARWLDQQLIDTTRVLVSPALRCEQTILNLGRKFTTCPALGPDGTPQALLELAQWPECKVPVLVVGHQPMLGQSVSRLLGLQTGAVSIRKGAVWWLRHRVRDGRGQTVLLTVQTPEFL